MGLVVSFFVVYFIEIAQFVISGGRATVPETYPKYLREIIANCWKHEHRDRPEFKQVLVTLEEHANNYATLRKQKLEQELPDV